MAKDLACTESQNAAVDLEVYRQSRAVYQARKVMGLLLPDETLQDLYWHNLKWKLEMVDKACVSKTQKRPQLPVRHP